MGESMVDDETLDRRRAEVAEKLERLRRLLWRRSADALYLSALANTAWLAAGAATYVDESVERAACTLLVTPDAALVLTDPIEAPRLRAEERLDALGFEFVVEPWHAHGQALQRLTRGQRVGADLAGQSRGGLDVLDLSGDLVALRSHLSEGEQARLRAGARLAGAAMWEATRAVAPGMTELEAAAALDAACRTRGGFATVTLVGSDERISAYRHSLPTEKIIERLVMLVVCFRYHGLVSALTRMMHFGEAPDALRQLNARVAQIDAAVMAATQPGRTLGALYETLREAYTRAGAPEAIEQHHQGGTIAYLGRETLARPGELTRVALGQAFAWNPSLRGAKSEDTLLVTASGPEIVTAMEGWPTLRFETEIGALERPTLLERL